MVPPQPDAPANADVKREQNLERLRSELFDLAIIGGGIGGAAIARDAAMRGLTTALVDKGDFAGATSSRSSKLIHGGLRYLPQGQLRLVYEALRERERLRHLTAPHLVRPIRFLFPFYRGRHPSALALSAGLFLYDLFARTPRHERHRRLNATVTQTLEPLLGAQGLNGGAQYVDGWADDARVTLENVLDATAHGAVVANYVAVSGMEHIGQRLRAISVRDLESGSCFEIRARAFVNAAGPWADVIRRLDEPGCAPSVRLTKGVHLVIASSRLPLKNSLVLTSRDDRIIFLMPHGEYVLVGTTDTDFDGKRDEVSADAADIDYLLGVIGDSIPGLRLSRADIASSYAGLRALAVASHARPSTVSREEIIVTSRSGLVTAAGGKLTTHRETAERVVDRVLKMLGVLARKSPTLSTPLPGARPLAMDGDGFSAELPAEARALLYERYGSRAEIVAGIAAGHSGMAERLVPGAPAIAAEVVYSVRHEFARSIEDFIVRRTAMTWRAPAAAIEAAPRVAAIMAQELRWDTQRQSHELDSFDVAIRRLFQRSGM
jgi:glycerol-3-phosphate dehydrogenase